MDLLGKKLWGSINLDNIKEAKEKAPKKFKNNDYGNQMTFDARQWEDGGISLSVSYQDANGEWQRINIGNVRISNDQGQAAPAQQAAPAPSNDTDLPF